MSLYVSRRARRWQFLGICVDGGGRASSRRLVVWPRPQRPHGAPQVGQAVQSDDTNGSLRVEEEFGGREVPTPLPSLPLILPAGLCVTRGLGLWTGYRGVILDPPQSFHTAGRQEPLSFLGPSASLQVSLRGRRLAWHAD